MQVVYSGGSTPTPSPRLPRKHLGYGRPIFMGHQPSKSTPPIHHRSTSKDLKSSPDSESSLRDSIPAMRKPVAITCLVLNILLPGLGTFVAGFTVLCGSTIRFKDMTKQKVMCSNTWVAFLQFVTAFLFLLGWIWSIVWGVAFITISNDYFKNFKRECMHQKHPLNESIDIENMNGSSSMNKTGSVIGLSSNHVHLQKPVMFRSSSADQPTHPLIVLNQKTPVISHSETSLATKQISHEAKTSRRHHKSKMCSDEELSPINLEQIVIHSLPKAPVRRGILRREDTVTSNTSSVSFSDDHQHVP
ncbi:mRNA-decapping enzyme 1B [Mactra antiquata]